MAGLKTLGVFFLVVTSDLQAAGFYLKEQSIVSQGQAFAGVAAQSGLASSTYFNPAGLGNLEQDVFEGGLHLILPDQKVNGATSNTALGNSNSSQQEPLDSVVVVPNLYYAKPVGGYVLGVGVNTPFGSKNSYDSDYFGRFDHLSADLKTVDYTLVLSRQLNEKFRIGGGLYYQTLEVEQTKIAATTQQSTLKGETADVGFSWGVQYQAAPATVLGLSHRSGTTQEITDGTNRVSGSGLLPVGTHAATAVMRMPSITSLGIEHALDGATDLYLGVSHYNWSVYDQLDVATSGIGTSSTVNNYHDTTSYSIGFNHRYNAGLDLRAGIHVDPTPTDDLYRSHSTPDGDRAWLSFGGSKQLDSDLIVDFAYSYIHVDDATINRKSVGSGATAHTISSTTETHHNIFSVGLRKFF